MVGALFDTNVVIDYLNTVDEAREELSLYRDRAISIVTWMEVVVGASRATEAATRAFLGRFELIHLDAPIAEEAVALRKSHRMKLPDAIIWATARVRSILLVTRNTKDFPSDDPGIRMPYAI